MCKAEQKCRHPRVAFEARMIANCKRRHSKDSARKRQSEENKVGIREAKTEKRMKYSA
jgi:hypothetical protein